MLYCLEVYLLNSLRDTTFNQHGKVRAHKKRVLLSYKLTALALVLITACSGGSSGGGESSGYEGVKAVDLTCNDGDFWGECVLTWEDGVQQKVCVWTPFGCEQVGKQNGQVVRSINYYNEFGNSTCLKLFEGGWIEDCYTPSQWLMPSGGGDASAADSWSSSDQSTNASGSGLVPETTTTSTTTTTVVPPPPGIALGLPRQTLGQIYDKFVNGSEVVVTAVFQFELPIYLVNNRVDSVCIESLNPEFKPYLINRNDFTNWDVVFSRTNCTKLAFVAETIDPVDLAEFFQIHVALGNFANGKQGFVNECFATGQETCRAFELTISVKSSSVATVSKTVRASLQINKKAEIFAFLTG